MPKPVQPLVEVFGFPIDNHSKDARASRALRLCPFNNRVPECTKNSVEEPLGVCSIYESDSPAIICPVRFREGWLLIRDAAAFFFKPGTKYRRLSEIRLHDAYGKSAGNIDYVLASLDDRGNVTDFGALEVQGVYISGNITNPFKHYMENPEKRDGFVWRGQKNYPGPDFLSSSRKRLAPQLMYKGGILHSWGKRQAVAVDEPFWATLPKLRTVRPEDADIAWFIYGLDLDQKTNRYTLVRRDAVYTKFEDALLQITTTKGGNVADFVRVLNAKIAGILPESDDPDPRVDSEHDVA